MLPGVSVYDPSPRQSTTTSAALAAKKATSSIPIVTIFPTNPVELGLVASLSRPAGNITGVTFLVGTLTAKQFEILHKTVPKAALVGFLLNPANADAEINGLAGADQLALSLSAAPDFRESIATQARYRRAIGSKGLTGSLMGVVTPYATGPAPVYFASGYISRKDFWRLGLIFGLIFLGALLLAGTPYLLITRHGR